MRAWSVASLAVAVLALSGCGYNTLQAKDEAVKAAWSEVVNQYQRRADLIPNLVNTVKGSRSSTTPLHSLPAALGALPLWVTKCV